MKVVGTRYIKQQPWFGQVEQSAKKVEYKFKELEAIVNSWFKGK